MTNKELLNELQKTCHFDHQQLTTLLNALLKLMAKAAIDQIPVTLSGLGTFVSHKHPEYIQEDPLTGKQVLFPPRISYRMQAETKNPEITEQGMVIVDDLSEYTHLSHEISDSFIKAFAQTVQSHLSNLEDVEVHGLGMFTIIKSHQTELHRIAFTPDELMRAQVNAPFNCFEPVVIKHAEASAVPEQRTEEEIDACTSDIEADAVSPVVIHDADEGSASEEGLPETDADIEEFSAETVANDSVNVPVGEEPVGEEPAEEELATSADSDIKEPVPAVVSVSVEEASAVSSGADEAMKSSVQSPDEKSLNPSAVESQAVSLVKQSQTNSLEAKKKSNSSLLYTSIALIMLSCICLVVYLFILGNDGQDEPVRAELAEEIKPKANEQFVQAADTLEGDTLMQTVEPDIDAALDKPEEKVVTASVQPVVEQDVMIHNTKAESQSVAVSDHNQKQQSYQQAKPQDKKPSETVDKEFHRLLGDDGKPVMVTLNQGERLTIVALNHFGDKSFWPYVFEVNSDRLKAPNMVQAGMKLYLPDPAYYDIDASSESSIRKAKNRAAQLLK